MAWNDWVTLVAAVRALDTRVYTGRFEYTDADILLTYLWAVFNRQPARWACGPEAWPLFARRSARPSRSRLSRRLRTAGVRALMAGLFAHLAAAASTPGLVLVADGKAILVAAHSGDRQARFGGQGRRGYKLHALADSRGIIVAFKVTPLNAHEAVMAARMLRDLPHQGYVLADSNYENRHLYARCRADGGQLVAPRRRSHRGRGTRKQIDPSRRRGIDMLEESATGFGPALLEQRRVIERTFGRLEMNSGLGRAPSWVRGLERVRRWACAAVILDLFRATLRAKAAAA